MKKKYVAEIDWGDGGECRLSAASLDEAWDRASEWAREGEWDPRQAGVCRDGWVHDVWCALTVTAVGGDDGDDDDLEEEILVWSADAAEPECLGGDGHDWVSLAEIEGGCRENPGVWSRGGVALSLRSHCRRCGMTREEHVDDLAIESCGQHRRELRWTMRDGWQWCDGLVYGHGQELVRDEDGDWRIQDPAADEGWDDLVLAMIAAEAAAGGEG